MASVVLFPREQIVGVFRGFREGGLEFHADLVLPYRNDFQSIPMHGQFLLVQLETPEEAVLGRIASFSSEGKLSVGTGEEFTIRALRDGRPVPEDLREQYLKYRVNIRVLGVLRSSGAGVLSFVASHRRLPHVGSPVAFPSPEVLREIAGHNQAGAPIGHLALGEYIYAEGSDDLQRQEWMQIKDPQVLVRFPVESLVSRRSFVLARAGFGKSNLTKLLFSQLYHTTPTVTKRSGRQAPVGTVIFDRDGEYFWPDDNGRPGLCDVPELDEQLVVFTSRRGPSAFYESFVAGSIRLDIRQLPAADVIAIALSPERQEQQNVRKLAALAPARWQELVNLVHQHGSSTPLEDIARILELETKQEVEALAARANMTAIVRMLHDPGSQLLDMLFESLEAGKLCIIDVSQMRGGQALVLSGLILRRIFDHNQEEFTAAEPKTIPTIAVVEEAQSVLNERASGAEPYITWVKEGRKYDLGAMLITQQPGSIPTEILSQGDNWFIFHLLSAADLYNVQKANAHFSEDLLSALLNEPIAGQGVFWSSVEGKAYPVPVRIRSFERLYRSRDPQYAKPAADTYAARLKTEYIRMRERMLIEAQAAFGRDEAEAPEPALDGGTQPPQSGAPDIFELVRQRALMEVRSNDDLMRRLQGEGVPWGVLIGTIERCFPETFRDRNRQAAGLVPVIVSEILGRRDHDWHTYRHPVKGQLYVRAGREGANGHE